MAKKCRQIKGKKMYSIFTIDLNKRNLERVIENEVQKILNDPDILYTIIRENLNEPNNFYSLIREIVEYDIEQYEMIFDSKKDVKNFEYMLG